MSDLSTQIINFCKNNNYCVDVQASTDSSCIAYFPAQLDRNLPANFYKYEIDDLTDCEDYKQSEVHKFSKTNEKSIIFPTFVSRLVVYQDIIITTQDLDIPMELIFGFKDGKQKERISDIFPRFENEELNEKQHKTAILFHKVCLAKSLITLEEELAEDEDVRDGVVIMLNVFNQRGIH